MIDEFLKILKEWKEGHWVIFAAQSTRKRSTKRFWCNLDGEYKVVLKSKESKEETKYQGADMEEAYKIYKTL
jgi:hypothetical protein